MSYRNTDPVLQRQAKGMIKRWLHDRAGYVDELTQRMGRLAESCAPLDALAAWFLGGLPSEDNLYFEDYQPKPNGQYIAATHFQWVRLLSFCRKATIEVGLEQYPERIHDLARVGRWPKRIPMQLAGIEIFNSVDDMNLDSGIPWAYAWMLDEEAFQHFIDNKGFEWDPATTLTKGAVIEGLLLAIQLDHVEVSEYERLQLVLAVREWCKGLNQDYAVQFAEQLYNPVALAMLGDEEELQHLAVFWDKAAYKLGANRMPLWLQHIQSQDAWLDGFASSFMEESLPSDLGSMVNLFNKTDNPFLRIAIWNINSQNAGFKFGVNQEISPPMPDYDTALVWLARLEQEE